jgi:hypothetical protein
VVGDVRGALPVVRVVLGRTNVGGQYQCTAANMSVNYSAVDEHPALNLVDRERVQQGARQGLMVYLF